MIPAPRTGRHTHRTPTARRGGSIALALALGLTLAACTGDTSGDTSAHDAGGELAGAVEKAAEDLASNAEDFACPVAVIQGFDLTVDLSGAQLEGVVVNGNRNAVTVGSLPDLAIQGFDNVFTAPTLGDYQESGSRNEFNEQ